MPSHSSKPVVACWCSTFLAAEMHHVYRQITGLREFEPVILTQKRRHADKFPFPPEQIVELPRPSPLIREWRRFKYRRLIHGPVSIGERERIRIETELENRNAEVLHIYFGNAGMTLLPLLLSGSRPCPAVVSFHGADAGVDMDKPGWRNATRNVLDRADAILARSESLARDLEELGCAPGKITIQRTGIPMAAWPMAERESAGGWRLANRAVGSPDREKGI